MPPQNIKSCYPLNHPLNLFFYCIPHLLVKLFVKITPHRGAIPPFYWRPLQALKQFCPTFAAKKHVLLFNIAATGAPLCLWLGIRRGGLCFMYRRVGGGRCGRNGACRHMGRCTFRRAGGCAFFCRHCCSALQKKPNAMKKTSAEQKIILFGE